MVAVLTFCYGNHEVGTAVSVWAHFCAVGWVNMHFV